ncbi:MAG: SRPBCC family protein [Chitinophagaceae bacterium]|nr:SRPBCC family protein [Bacteroidota bacterium]MCC6258612.1 SRPBCC family protein [Chitinophagaceae bacterium]
MNNTINDKAPVKSKNKIDIAAAAEVVWDKLADISNWPAWQKGVTHTVVYGEIKEGTRFDWKAGGLSFKSQIHTSIREKEFGWTGKILGASAVHNWYFEEKENKTIVTIEESLQGILPSLFTRYFQKILDSGIIKNLEELKEAVEGK